MKLSNSEIREKIGDIKSKIDLIEKNLDGILNDKFPVCTTDFKEAIKNVSEYLDSIELQKKPYHATGSLTTVAPTLSLNKEQWETLSE